MIVCVFYAKEVIRLLFSYGKFGENAVIITAEALLFYSLGLYAYVGVQFLSKGFYALGDNRRPARYSIMAILINIALNALLIQKWNIGDWLSQRQLLPVVIFRSVDLLS